MTRLNFLMLSTSALLAALGQVCFKLGAENSRIVEDYLNAWIFSGGVLYFSGAVIWIYVLSSENLTTIFPFTALTFVIVYLFGFFYFKESLSVSGLLGVGFVLVGLYFLSR